MTESAFTRKLIAALRKTEALRDAWIVKHNDATTGGVPDFSVTVGRHTEWFEVKLHPNRPTKLQAWTLEKIGAGGHVVTLGKYGNWTGLDGMCDVYHHSSTIFDRLVERIAAMFAADNLNQMFKEFAAIKPETAGRYSDLVEGCAEHNIPLVKGHCPKCFHSDGKPFILDMQSRVLLPRKGCR